MIRLFSILFCFMLVSGCLSPVHEASKKTYLLSTTPHFQLSNAVTRPHSILLLSSPDTDAWYDTRNMIYTDKLYQVSYFNYTEWAETPSQMILSVMVQALQNSHHFQAVVSPPYVGQYDYFLKINIQKLQQNFISKPLAELAVTVQLYRADDNQLIAAGNWQFTQPMTRMTPEAGVIAFNEIMDTFLNKLSHFLAKHTSVKKNT